MKRNIKMVDVVRYMVAPDNASPDYSLYLERESDLSPDDLNIALNQTLQYKNSQEYSKLNRQVLFKKCERTARVMRKINRELLWKN